MTSGGLLLYCPSCADYRICASIPTDKSKQSSSRRWVFTNHADIQWFQRRRLCRSCDNQFVTAEVEEDFLRELVQLRARLAATNQQTINQIRARAPWIQREETIPRELAERFIRRTAWWLTHSCGRPVRAPGHASRIRQTHHGWEIDFGANGFLVGKAIERSRNRIHQFFEAAIEGKVLKLEDLKHDLAIDISGAVSNGSGDEYGGNYPTTDGQLIFGAQAIDVDDGVAFLVEESHVGSLFL